MPLTIFWFMLFAAISSVYIFLPIGISLIISCAVGLFVGLSLIVFYVMKQNLDKDISALIWALRNTPKKD
jgi:hypothetical protein